MLLNSKRLINLPVRTKAGLMVGKMMTIDIDSDTGRIAALHVRVPGLVPHLIDKEATIAWAQVVSMDEKEVIVADATVPVGARWIAQGITRQVT